MNQEHEFNYKLSTQNYLFNLSAYDYAIRMDVYVIYRENTSIRHIPDTYKNPETYFYYNGLYIHHLCSYMCTSNGDKIYGLSFNELVYKLIKNYDK